MLMIIDWAQLTKTSEVQFGFAADEKLLQHYVEKLGAEPICMLHQFHFGIFGDKMKEIMEVYKYEWTDEQL